MIGLIYNINDAFRDKDFLKKMIALALPVALQGLLNTAVNLADNLMIGALGENAIAAVGLANKVFFVFILITFGIVSGSSVLTAQYWGVQDIKNIRKVLGLSLILCILCSLFFTASSMLYPEFIMSIFTNSPDTIKLGASYLSIVAISYPFTAISMAYISILRAVNQVKVPVAITCIALFINVFFNYMLIYGNFGAPALGVPGAAIATTIARVCEMIILLLIVYVGKGPAAGKIKEMLGYSKDFIKKYIVTASPVIANELMWGLGVTMYSLVYGRMGDMAVATITIAQTIQDLLLVLFQGIGTATAIMLGNTMGAGKLDMAKKYASRSMILQTLLTIVIAILCVAFRWNFINLYNISDTVAHDVSACLIIFALYMPFKMINYIIIVGILRSGGDTKACLILDTIGVWLIGIPLAYLGGMVLELPIYWVYAMVLTEELFKFIFGFRRYKQRKWLKNLTIE